MPDMTYAEAAKIARRGKNEFRAFEYLEDMLVKAAQAEAAIPQAQARLKEVEEAIARAESDQKLVETGMAETKALAQSERARLAKEHNRAVAENREKIDLLRADITELENSLEARQVAFDETLETLVAREAEARAKAEAAEAALAALRASLPG